MINPNETLDYYNTPCGESKSTLGFFRFNSVAEKMLLQNWCFSSQN